MAFRIKLPKIGGDIGQIWNISGGALGRAAGKAWDDTLGSNGLGGWLGDRFKSPSRPSLRMDQFDIKNEATKYATEIGNQRIRNKAANEEMARVLQERAAAPTLANAQLRAAQDQNLAQTFAAARSARQSPLAQRATLSVQTDMGAELARQNMQQGLQERVQAQGALSQQLGKQAQTAGEDITSGFNIAFSPETMMSQGQRAASQADLQRSLAQSQFQQQLVGALIGGASQGIAAGMSGDTSDKNAKKDIKQDGRSFEDFLDKIQGYSFKYKQPDAPGQAPGQRFGVMAQDLEKSDIGKMIVKDTPRGKALDTVGGFGAVLAAQAELNKRIKKLESKQGKKG